MTETIGVAIGIGVFAFVFIYLGCLMWKKEKITLLHSYHYDKVSPSDKKVFCKIIRLWCYLYWNWYFDDCYNNWYNRFSIKFYRFCIGICCGIGVADLCRSKI